MLDKIGRPVIIRTYGDMLNSWTHEADDGRMCFIQEEYAYKDIDTETGDTVGIGSEDFSPMRWRQSAQMVHVYTWDGERRNAGGHRWFTYQGTITIKRKERKAVRDYLMRKYGAAEVQLR